MEQVENLKHQTLLSNPLFLPVAVVTLILGNALDLLGTYAAQPHFENEANPVHNFLLSHGVYMGWPGAFIGKFLYCLFFSWALWLFLARRRDYYPPQGADVRGFFTQFFYGRVLSWAETLYRLPRLRPALLFIGAMGGLTGPYFVYLGYENLAVLHGWWIWPWVSLGNFGIDSLLIVFVSSLFGLLFWLLWADFQSTEMAA